MNPTTTVVQANRKMKSQKIDFSWEDTGHLEIEVFGNQNARLRYRPSDKFVAETLAKFRKKTAIASKEKRQTNSKAKPKEP